MCLDVDNKCFYCLEEQKPRSLHFYFTLFSAEARECSFARERDATTGSETFNCRELLRRNLCHECCSHNMFFVSSVLPVSILLVELSCPSTINFRSHRSFSAGEFSTRIAMIKINLRPSQGSNKVVE